MLARTGEPKRCRGRGTVLELLGNGTATGGTNGGTYILAGSGNEKLNGGNKTRVAEFFLTTGSDTVSAGTGASVIVGGSGFASIVGAGNTQFWAGTGTADITASSGCYGRVRV